MEGIVTITENGREGRIQYSEGPNTITGYWEFGGGDVVAIISMGTAQEWQRTQAWAVERRAAILRRVAEEVVAKRAPTCTAEIDDARGAILLRQKGPTPNVPVETVTPEAKAAIFTRRYTNIKAMVGIGVLIIALIAGSILWVGKKVLLTAPASGVPLGLCVRTDTHIASLIQSNDPHLPEISGRGGNTTTSISILLIPLDGSRPHVIPIVDGISGNGYSLARIMGSDGHTLWFDATGLFGVRLSDYGLVTPADLRKVNTSVDPGWWEDPRGMDIVDGRLHMIRDDRSAAMDVDPSTWKAVSVAPKISNVRFQRPSLTDFMAAGFITVPGQWFGVHSYEELESGFKPGKWVRIVENADDAKQLRRLCYGETEASSEGDHHRIRSMAPVNDAQYLNAAFLRMQDKMAPLRLADPDGVLMMFTSAPGLQGTLMIARVDLEGKVLWTTDTGLDRFGLQQILPGTHASAFVGTRPPIPDKLSEPLVVWVDNNSGRLTSHSLWR